MSKIKTISQNIFLSIVALTLVLFLPLSSLSLEPLKTFVILTTGILFVLGIIIYKIKQDSFFITKNPMVLSVLGIILASFISAIFSNNPNISLFGRQLSYISFSGFLSLIALMYAVYSYFDDIKGKTRLFLTIHISGVFLICVHLLSIVLPFFPSFGFFLNNTINTLGRWYDLGLFALFITFSSVLILHFLKHLKFYKIIGWIGFVLSMFLVILVNSVTVLVLGVVFSSLYIIFNAITQHDSRRDNRIPYETLIVLVVSVIFILIGGKTGVLIDSVFQLQTNEIRPSVSATYIVAQQVIMNEPLTGVGLDRFDTAWLQYRPIGTNITQFWDTDFRLGYSIILSMVVMEGVIGLLAWIIFIGLSLYFSFKLILVSSEQKNNLFLYIYSAFGYIFFLVVSLVYTPSIILIGLMFIFMGLFISNLKHAGIITFKQISITQNPRISFVYVLTLVLLLISFVYVGYIQTSQYASRVLFDYATTDYNKTGDLQKLESKILDAQFIYFSDVYSRALTEIGLLKINQIIQNKNITQEEALSQFETVSIQTANYAKEAISYDPQSYSNKLLFVKVYKNLISLGVNDAKDQAISLLDEISKISPQNPTINLEKARIYTLTKEFDLAIEQIKQAIELKPNYIDAVFLLSQIQVQKGEIDQAVVSIKSAIQVDPNNANLRFQAGLLYYNQEKYNSAIVLFENASDLSPSFANAKYFLGLSYYKNNQIPNAISVFEKLNTQIPENQEVQLILKNLKEGSDPFSGIQPPLDDRPEQRDELPLEDDVETSEDSETQLEE